jgi:RimJ/RimL family protein N-acetyltransferase
MDTKAIPFIEGDVVYCRLLTPDDAPAMSNWLNDDDVTRLLYQGLRPTSAAAIADTWTREANDANIVSLAVCRKDDHRFVGTTGLYDLQWVMHSASFRVFIGDKASWDKGIGTECARLMLRYGFDKLNLNRVWLGVNATNERAVRAYEKAGFVREGVLRQEQFRNGRFYDVIRMGVLRDEYRSVVRG